MITEAFPLLIFYGVAGEDVYCRGCHFIGLIRWFKTLLLPAGRYFSARPSVSTNFLV
jgi:hypothetical protein